MVSDFCSDPRWSMAAAAITPRGLETALRPASFPGVRVVMLGWISEGRGKLDPVVAILQGGGAVGVGSAGRAGEVVGLRIGRVAGLVAGEGDGGVGVRSGHVDAVGCGVEVAYGVGAGTREVKPGGVRGGRAAGHRGGRWRGGVRAGRWRGR